MKVLIADDHRLIIEGVKIKLAELDPGVEAVVAMNLEELDRAVAAGLPVVLTSRCIEGGVWPVYGYSGGACRLRDMGVILGGSLRAQKARILLMVALGLCSEPRGPEALRTVRGVFENFPK